MFLVCDLPVGVLHTREPGEAVNGPNRCDGIYMGNQKTLKFEFQMIWSLKVTARSDFFLKSAF